LHDGENEFNVSQFDASADAFRPVHGRFLSIAGWLSYPRKCEFVSYLELVH
jgi:hypothetical protein